MEYYGYQDITEQGWEPQPLTVVNKTVERRWPSVALVVPIAWAIALPVIVLILCLFHVLILV